jgi:hypothetical protein
MGDMARIRSGIRSLMKSPLVSLVVVLSLGLGIGANTAIFSLMHQVLLSALPVAHPEELVLVTSPGEFKSGSSSTNQAGGMEFIFSYPVFHALEKQPAGVKGVAGFDRLIANLAFGNQTVPGSMMLVSGEYFPVLGVEPLLGRLIAPADDAAGGGKSRRRVGLQLLAKPVERASRSAEPPDQRERRALHDCGHTREIGIRMALGARPVLGIRD